MDADSSSMSFLFLTLFFRWACDNTVTHYIYQGRVGDSTREYRGVKERGIHVVSQHWLEAVSSTLANTKRRVSTHIPNINNVYIKLHL